MRRAPCSNEAVGTMGQGHGLDAPLLPACSCLLPGKATDMHIPNAGQYGPLHRVHLLQRLERGCVWGAHARLTLILYLYRMRLTRGVYLPPCSRFRGNPNPLQLHLGSSWRLTAISAEWGFCTFVASTVMKRPTKTWDNTCHVTWRITWSWSLHEAFRVPFCVFSPSPSSLLISETQNGAPFESLRCLGSGLCLFRWLGYLPSLHEPPCQIPRPETCCSHTMGRSLLRDFAWRGWSIHVEIP